MSLVLLVHLGSYSPGPADWGQLGSWLSDSAPEDALVAGVRLLALGLAWWLTASTALYGFARLTQVPALVRGVRWATLPPLRRVIDGAVATTIVASTTFGGGRVAMAEPVHEGPVVVRLDQQADPPPGVPSSKPAYQPRPAGDGSTAPEPMEPSATTTSPSSANMRSTTTNRPEERSTNPLTTPPGRDAEHPRASAVYVVQPGDNLWKIAHHHLATDPDRPLATITAKEVRRYWVQLVQTNRYTIRSADPNLIYPGENIALPPQPDTS